MGTEIMEAELFEAAMIGDIEAYPFCRISVDHGHMSNIFNKVTPLGNSLLHVAASLGHEQMIHLIAYHFPNLITKKNNRGDTPLHVAARAGKLSPVREIVNHTITSDRSWLKMVNNKGNTVLHEVLLALKSSMNGDQGKENAESQVALACDLIIADPEVSYYQNNASKSPLCLAVESENLDILKFILRVLPDGDQLTRRPEGKSLVQAAIEQRNLGALKTIMEFKRELFLLQDEKGNTPLHCAAFVGFDDGVHYLLEMGSAIAFERNKEGLYPVHIACQNGHVGVVRKLLKRWPDPSELLCNKERNILHLAAECGKQKVVRCILEESNSDELVNEMDDEGNTPLHLAANQGYCLVVRLLLSDKRTKSDRVNNQGQTAYDIAQKQALVYKAISGERNISAKVQLKAVDVKNDFGKCAMNSGDGQEQSTEALDPKKSWEPNFSNMMMTLSILFVAHYIHIFRDSRGFKIKNFKMIMDDLGMKIIPSGTEDVKDRMNVLLVVATIIVAAAFGASHQMPDQRTNTSAFRMFVICDTTAMYVSLMAVVILSWAQLVDVNVASIVLVFASTMVGFALYMICFAFLAAMVIGTRGTNETFLLGIVVLQVICFVFLTILCFPLIIPFILKELAGRCAYYFLFYCYFAAHSFMAGKF